MFEALLTVSYTSDVMPFSQTHLLAAHKLLNETNYDWSADHKSVASFLFGSVAPDTRIISGQSRESTHFFTIPPNPNVTGPTTMMIDWPTLADPVALQTDHAALIAGYLTHLVMDEVWVEDVVMPCLFLAGERWGASHPNWLVYNATIAYLDYQAAKDLSSEIVAQVGEAEVEGTLPFIENRPLLDWQMHVSERIATNQFRSAEFAARNCDIPPDEMHRLISSETAMAEMVYPVVPKQNIEAFQQHTEVRMQQVVEAYFNRAYQLESRTD